MKKTIIRKAGKKLNREVKLKASTDLHNSLFEEKIEERIPESQGDLADRASDEIESDIRWRVEQIRRASREDNSKRTKAQRQTLKGSLQ